MYWLVYRTLTGYNDLLGPEHSGKIRPWIQGYGVTTKDMQDQMRAVYAPDTAASPFGARIMHTGRRLRRWGSLLRGRRAACKLYGILRA